MSSQAQKTGIDLHGLQRLNSSMNRRQVEDRPATTPPLTSRPGHRWSLQNEAIEVIVENGSAENGDQINEQVVHKERVRINSSLKITSTSRRYLDRFTGSLRQLGSRTRTLLQKSSSDVWAWMLFRFLRDWAHRRVLESFMPTKCWIAPQNLCIDANGNVYFLSRE